MGKKIKGLLTTLGIAAFMTISSGLYRVSESQQAVITQFGRPAAVVVNPIDAAEKSAELENLKESYEARGIDFDVGAGLYWKTPFIQSVDRQERRLVGWDGAPEEMSTLDKKFLVVDSTARWYISDPLLFKETVRTIEIAQARLDDIIDSAVREEVAKHPLVDAVRNSNREMVVNEEGLTDNQSLEKVTIGREQIEYNITQRSREACAELGIELEGVGIKRINYQGDVRKNVETRMISERNRIADRYRSEGQGEAKKIEGMREVDYKTIISEAYRTAEEIKGKADGKATAIYAEAYNQDPEFYQFLETLELYESGALTEGDTTLIMGNDSDVLKYLSTHEKP